MVESRRERQRRTLVAEIKATARAQLEEGGRAAVSWRGIAREVGMNPASLYTYFDGLDELFTALLIDSYHALAVAVEAAGERSTRRTVATRVLDLAAAYRRWAIEHPAQYNLVFTDVIPGYVAPEGGPTVEAQVRVLAPFIRALGGSPEAGAASAADERRFIGLFALMHGLVSLEINHHLAWPQDDNESIFLDRMRSALDATT